jgi:hypothetical protein
MWRRSDLQLLRAMSAVDVEAQWLLRVMWLLTSRPPLLDRRAFTIRVYMWLLTSWPPLV